MAAESFKTISGFKNADELAQKCLDLAEICRQDAIYVTARKSMAYNNVGSFEKAISLFKTIPRHKDADEMIVACEEKIASIKAEQTRLEKGRKIAAKEREKSLIRLFVVIIFITIAAIIALFISAKVYERQAREQAAGLISEGQYDEAYKLLEQIGDTETIKQSKNDRGLALLKSGDFDQAYKLLEEAGNLEAIANSKYERASALIQSGEYEQAYLLLDGVNYKDSADKRNQIKAQFEKAQIAKAEVGSIV